MPPKRKPTRLIEDDESAAKMPRLSNPSKYDFEAGKGSLQDAQLDLLTSGYVSDLTLTCKGRTWKVHKNILGQRSAFFRAICEGNFMDSDTVRLEDDDPIGIHAMLQYLYARVTPTAEDSTLNELAIQLVTADKYCLQNLALSIRDVIEKLVLQLQQRWYYVRETRRSVQDFVDIVFAEDAGKVWDDLKSTVAELVLGIMKKQKEVRDEMEEMMDGAPALRKLVLSAALGALDRGDLMEEGIVTDLSLNPFYYGYEDARPRTAQFLLSRQWPRTWGRSCPA